MSSYKGPPGVGPRVLQGDQSALRPGGDPGAGGAAVVLLLDLYCGAGGAAKGYKDAGFTVVGVDNVPQSRYRGDAFIQADALEFLAEHGHEYDAIHASPPCQAYSSMSRNRGDHPSLYAPTRDGLHFAGKPFVIENVIGAPYHSGFVLCGSMFGLKVRRHRNFETSWLEFLTLRCAHDKQGRPITVTGDSGGKPSSHSWKGIRSEWPLYMGMPWATPKECSQAIPPAYTRYVGERLMEQLL